MSGGIDEEAILTASPEAVAEEAADAVRQTEGQGLVVTPGCVIPAATPAANVQAALRAVRGDDVR